MQFASLILAGINILLIITDFIFSSVWDPHLLRYYKVMDIILLLISVSAITFFWLLKPENVIARETGTMTIVLLILIWAAVFTGLDYQTQGLTTYLLTLLICTFFLYLNIYSTIFLITASIIALYLTMFFTGQLQENFLSLTFFILPILTFPVAMSIRNYKNQQTDFINRNRIMEMNDELASVNEPGKESRFPNQGA